MKREYFINLDYNCNFSKEKKRTEIKYNLRKFNCSEFEITFPEKKNKTYYDHIAENTKKVSKKDNFKNDMVYVYQSFTREKFNEGLIKLFIVCSILNENYNNTRKLDIIYIAPFLPYMRQKEEKSNFLLKNIFQTCVIKTVMTYDLHYHYNDKNYSICSSGSNIKKLLVSAIPFFIKDIKSQYKDSINKIVIVFPDKGAKDRFFNYFKEDFTTFCLKKTRCKNDSITISTDDNVKNLKNKKAIIIDDIIDTGKTVVEATNFLVKNGIKSVDIYATHGIFSGNSVKKLNNNKNIKSITISNSIRYDDSQNNKLPRKFKVIKLNPNL